MWGLKCTAKKSNYCVDYEELFENDPAVKGTVLCIVIIFYKFMIMGIYSLMMYWNGLTGFFNFQLMGVVILVLPLIFFSYFSLFLSLFLSFNLFLSLFLPIYPLSLWPIFGLILMQYVMKHFFSRFSSIRKFDALASKCATITAMFYYNSWKFCCLIIVIKNLYLI